MNIQRIALLPKANEILQQILKMSAIRNTTNLQTPLIALTPIMPTWKRRQLQSSMSRYRVMVEDKSDQEFEGKPISVLSGIPNNKAEFEIEYKASDWKDIVENALEATEPLKFDLHP